MTIAPLILGLLAVLSGTVRAVSGQPGLSPTDPDVFEGPCRTIQPARNFTSYLPLVTTPAVYGVYFASQSNLRVYAATFLGRPAQSQDEISKMCLNILFAVLVAQQRGYGNRTYINFAVPREFSRGLGTFDFSKQLAHTNGVDTSFQKTSKETVVWSDGKDHLLFVRCINGKFMDWKVASRSPPTAEVKSTVLNIIESLGFKRELAVDLTRSPENVVGNRNGSGSGNTKGNCPPLQSVREFTRQTLADFRQFKGADGHLSAPLRRALVRPITYLQKMYNTLHGLLHGLLGRSRTGLIGQSSGSNGRRSRLRT